MQIIERTDDRLIVHHKPWNAWLSTAFTVAVGVLIVAYGAMNVQPVALSAGVGFVVVLPLLTAHFARPIWVTFDRQVGLATVVRSGMFGRSTQEIALSDVTGVECCDFVGRRPRSILERLQFIPPGQYVVRLILASGKTLSLASLQSCERGEHNQLAQVIRSFLGLEAQAQVA
jgi:hypothetical protein